MNANPLKKPLCLQARSWLSVMKQLQFVDLVHVPTRMTVSSSLQIDVLMTTDVQRFDSTGIYPFSSSDHHLIASNLYARGVCVVSLSHQFVFVTNFQLQTGYYIDLLVTKQISCYVQLKQDTF